MTNTVTPTGKMLTLIKREFWEQRIMFVLVPLCCIVLVVFTFGTGMLKSYFGGTPPLGTFMGGLLLQADSAVEAMAEFAASEPERLERFWEQFYMQFTPLLFLVFWSVMIYYLIMTLYQQRKDRSILFWNSMPVSDTLTVFSKLLAGLVCVHGIFLGAMLCVHLLIMAIWSFYGLAFDVKIWDTFIAPAHLFSRFFWFVLYALVNIIWCLPVYAWLLFNSAWARSAPFAWAVGPLVIMIVAELIIYDRSQILVTVFEHLFPGWMYSSNEVSYAGQMNQVLTLELLISLIMGGAFVYAAIRFNRSEDI